MAKDKKSFIGYCDWERTFDFLSDEEAGKLIKHFFAYINDKDPILDDRLLQMAFEPIKLQLNRDLSKYEEVKRKRSEAGRQGGLKSGESRGKQSEPIDSDALSDEANEAFASNAKQNEANEAVTDTVIVTVNDTVTDTDILLSKESKLKLVWDIFPGKRNSFEKDFKNFEKKTKGIELDFEKMMQEVKNAPNVYFQTWINDFVPKSIPAGGGEILDIPEEFIPLWNEWKEYRKARKFSPYAGIKWEQMAVDKLLGYSNRDPVIAKKILEKTYQNNYQGFFPLKEEDGKSNNQNSKTGTSNVRNGNDKVSGTTDILGGARYTEFT